MTENTTYRKYDFVREIQAKLKAGTKLSELPEDERIEYLDIVYEYLMEMN
jgi:hypothetical protein